MVVVSGKWQDVGGNALPPNRLLPKAPFAKGTCGKWRVLSGLRELFAEVGEILARESQIPHGVDQKRRLTDRRGVKYDSRRKASGNVTVHRGLPPFSRWGGLGCLGNTLFAAKMRRSPSARRTGTLFAPLPLAEGKAKRAQKNEPAPRPVNGYLATEP